ncbi:MAG: phage portal protein family protein [Sodalis sp. (in: enterobacteria)]|uniref:phage portal protein family protein n=1 Tax=Sodalis sp. (in: enterobacteria) TaxID=1898979 RepID=UPI003F3DD68C
MAESGLFRVLVWTYLFKNIAARDLAEFLEIYGLPTRVGTYFRRGQRGRKKHAAVGAARPGT